MQTAFVTGGTGFLGSNLVGQLRDGGWRVVAVHREGSSTGRLAQLGVELRKAGLDDPAALAGAMPEGVDAVFHVAADLSWWRPNDERQRRVNVDGTRNVARAALERKARRFVHTSTVGAFGLGHAVIDERTPSTAARSKAGYIRTKWQAEQEVREAFARGLPAVILNPANILGPGDTTGWAKLLVQLKAGQLPGAPPGSGSWCHVREVARAHIEAAVQGTPGEQYLLGGTDASYADVTAIMAEVVGAKAPRPLPSFVLRTAGHLSDWASYLTRREPDLSASIAEVLCSRWRVDSSKAIRELGYRAIPIREMVDDTYRWLVAEKRM